MPCPCVPFTGSCSTHDKRIYGHTESGKPIDDERIEKLADDAEAGCDVNEIVAHRGKRGRPRLGSAPSTVESVRLDQELKERLARRAEDEGVPVSEVIREALRHHLEAS
jgi:CRISPR-associated endonuclease/helicase Cas3